MYSVAVDSVEISGNRNAGTLSSHSNQRWADWPPTQLEHHGQQCCETAREWLANTDDAQRAGGDVMSGPRWIREKFKWGPTSHPIFWCEVFETDMVDCGIHAALAFEVFSARLVKCFRVQMIQEFSASALSHWETLWADIQTDWLHGDKIYHEGCAVVNPATGRLKVWDPSSSWWIDRRNSGGYGSLRSIRIFSARSSSLEWENALIVPNQWHELETQEPGG
jgi:hypothetical protein